MPANVLMVQGASSSVGKSLLTAAVCRIYHRRGIRVAPFKAQNMSNNAAVCADGAEIGRAQALQAAAAGVEPTADMNPILLKPEAQSRSQVIVSGRVWQTLSARDFYRHKPKLWSVVTGALDRLRDEYRLIVAEGAGSPAELNLKEGDIVNMAVARYASASVLLVGDIDRGGVFAQLLGTLWLLPARERALVRGLVINKFRGDRTLFEQGVRLLEDHGSVPVLGIIPYLNGLLLPEEDAVALDRRVGSVSNLIRPNNQEAHLPRSPEIDIAVIRLPHISNFDDFDPLREEPGVLLRYVEGVDSLGSPHAILLPGTKSTMADLVWLKQTGLAEAIRRRAAASAVVGICGGYQMLGRQLLDPDNVEKTTAEMAGLDLLPVETTFAKEKSTCRVQACIRGGPGWFAELAESRITGYEMHMGRTPIPCGWLEIIERNGIPAKTSDGAVSPDGRLWGCYVHGLFANDGFRRAWLHSLAPRASSTDRTHEGLDAHLDRLANVVELALDMKRIDELCLQARIMEHV